MLWYAHIQPFQQGAKKIIFTACHSGKLKLAFTSPDVISTSPKSFSSSRIDFTLLLLFEFLKEHHLPVGQVKNRFHQPDSKIHQPWAVGHYFLCTLHFRLTKVCTMIRNNNLKTTKHKQKAVILLTNCCIGTNDLSITLLVSQWNFWLFARSSA